MFKYLKNHKFLYELYLIVAALFWAMAFIWIKQALDNGLSPQQVLMVRYSVAALLMLPFCRKELGKITGTDLVLGFIGGVVMFGGMLAQTMALGMTTPSNSAFITTTYVVMVPFVAWIVEKKKPGAKTYLCAVVALSGLYILTNQPGQPFVIEPATGLTALSALLFAVQVVYITYAGKRMGVKMLTFLPLAFVAVFTTAMTAVMGDLALRGPQILSAVGSVALASVFATIIAGVFQILGQSQVEPSRAAIIMSLESVFTCIVSVILGYDALTWSLLIGGVLIVAAIVIAEYQ